MVQESLTKIEKLPYVGLKNVADLVTIDRAILSLFENSKQEQFLMYLYDTHEDYDEYILFKVQFEEISSFLFRRISLRELILSKSKEFIFIIQSDLDYITNLYSENVYNDAYQILLEDINQSWLPEEDSYWEFNIPDYFISKFENELQSQDYVEKLRDHSIYFVVEPKGDKYASTVSTVDVTNFLRMCWEIIFLNWTGFAQA